MFKRLITYPFIWLVRFYQVAISPLKPPTCRFSPTCSTYAIEALRKYGLLKGGALALKRIMRCHPRAEGGDHPLPYFFSMKRNYAEDKEKG